MRPRFLTVLLALLLASPLAASPGLLREDKKTLRDAMAVLDTLTSTPDKGIPQELLAKAECILVFPSVAKGAFVEGGKAGAGRGVASCRQPDGTMGSAAFYVVGGESIGFQMSGQSADVVMLIMNKGGIDHLIAKRFTIGGEATASAGPVGQTAQAATDAQMGAQILSWSGSRGLFVGAALDGSVVRPNADANQRLYGIKTSGKDILVDSQLGVPAPAQPLVESIRRHMAVAVAQEKPEDQEERTEEKK